MLGFIFNFEFATALTFLIISGYRIFRGYKELCNAADRLPDVNHIVFVVHGVGGVMDESTIGRNAAHLRDNVSHILTKCFPKFQEQSGQRAEFFPVEWRTNLKLDEGLVDAITPQRVLGLRSVSDLFQYCQLGTIDVKLYVPASQNAA